MAEVKFKVGDKVQIRWDSEYHGESKSNPMNVPGKVSKAEAQMDEDYHNIEVQWDNGTWNNYRESDLELSNLPFKV